MTTQQTKIQSMNNLPLHDKSNQPSTNLNGVHHHMKQLFHKTDLEIEHLQKSQKENLKSISDVQTNDFTIKKANNSTECTQSQKTIKEQQNGMDFPKVDEMSPEFDLIQFSSTLELHRLLNIQVPFDEIKKSFLEESKKMNFNMCQNTSRFATIKKGSLSSCKCIIEILVRGQTSPNVYQIRQITNNSKKAKLIMIEGDETEFEHFCMVLLKRLYENKSIRLTSRQKTELFLHQERDELIQVRESGQSILKKIKKIKSKTKKIKMQVQAKKIVEKACQILKKTKQSIKQNNHIDYNVQIERFIESHWFKQLNILELFSQLYKDQFESFHNRRTEILKANNLYDIFKYLEIGQHYNQFRLIKDNKKSKTTENYPYISAIKIINNLQFHLSPTMLLQYMMEFQVSIKNCYDRYFSNKIKLTDMDDYLPITIFCVLCLDNQQFNLLAAVKMLLSYLSHQDQYQDEKKILTNIQAAFDFIIKEWQ